ncbi:MAG: aldehyde ferredoxin oxidoreductase family protein [Desulfobacula sp.]|uniref:aldehyde ferredoxin oxidoreductase family protein n=1 Tax=Desulfobacula sp. TaxID=2593537 RepID=UPI0025C28EC8|nr:aldehyde ferredoxin oxidoreductase family protein [Desulfobacula sp.]MCD4718656.1 aldehyde ferredoxin oxidoreductase family protein [Desulfobacula sp.]
MSKIPGIAGKILRINLTDQSIQIEDTPLDIVRKYLGARGFGIYYFNREVDPVIDPLGPENKLIFMSGTLAGSLIPGNNKINLTFKSPLTNTYSFSLCGGHWGPELKFAGYDGLIIEGKAENPVYLWIDDENVEIRAAEHLWGNIISQCDQNIKKELGKDMQIQIAAIGPAGENLNKMACITSGVHREFGRGGCGAVMGSKNLKAIAVRGTQDIQFHDIEQMKKLAQKYYAQLKSSPKIQDRRHYGTPEMVKDINERGLWCTRNFSQGYFEDGFKLEGPQMRKDIVVGDASCFGCPVACGKRSYVATEKYGLMHIEGPEFETIGLLGPNCGVSDWDHILKATKICDDYGFDTMNAGGCIALAMECFEKGIISLKETNGIELKFGNGDALVKILEMMALRKGIGDILAEGVKSASEKFGAPELGMHSKGQGLAVYDPRGMKGMGLTYATSPKGAHHMMATTMGPEIVQKNRLETKGKAALVREQQLSMCIVDSIGICSTLRAGMDLQNLVDGFNAVTGLNMDKHMFNSAAERTINLERLYNSKLGFSRKNDTLPKRFLTEPMKKGRSAGETVDLEVMLDEYYIVMGWTRDGLPTADKLKELNLKAKS